MLPVQKSPNEQRLPPRGRQRSPDKNKSCVNICNFVLVKLRSSGRQASSSCVCTSQRPPKNSLKKKKSKRIDRKVGRERLCEIFFPPETRNTCIRTFVHEYTQTEIHLCINRRMCACGRDAQQRDRDVDSERERESERERRIERDREVDSERGRERGRERETASERKRERETENETERKREGGREGEREIP
jgi:hypothetical protein